MNEMEQKSVLPDQIIMDEILTRIPAKTLGKFKSVSKHWKARISTPQFAKSHYKKQQQLNSMTNSSPKWLFFQCRQKSYLLNYEAYDDEDAAQKFRDCNTVESYNDPGGLVSLGKLLKPRLKGVEADPCGSSCGLVCLLVPNEGQFWLFNPILRQWQIIPFPDPSVIRQDIIMFCGFGYVSSIDDFKLVLGLSGMMYVLSFRNKLWRKIEVCDHKLHFGTISYSQVYWKGILINERLHWWSSNDGRLIAFDLLEEVFEEIPVPETLTYNVANMMRLSKSSGISSIGGCLCLSIFREKNNVEIWMLKQYGKWDSWVRLYDLHVPGCYEYNCAEMFGFTKTGKFLMRCWDNLPDGRFRWDVIFLIDPCQARPKLNPIWADGPISSINTFSESLISPFDIGGRNHEEKDVPSS